MPGVWKMRGPGESRTMRVERIVAVAAALALVGCSGGDTAGTPADREAATDESRDQPGIGAPTTAVEAAGTVAAAAAGQWPTTMPAFAPAYPGGTVESAMSGSTSEGSATIVGIRTPDSPDKVIDFYKERAKADGLDKVFNMEAGGSRMFSASDATGRSLTVQVSTEGGQTRGVLTAGTRQRN